jgi:hypothetical protein
MTTRKERKKTLDPEEDNDACKFTEKMYLKLSFYAAEAYFI